MIRVNIIGRTCKVFPMTERTIGEKTIKEISFLVACPRKYKRKVTVNGKTVEQRDNDFVLCKAIGTTAEFINNYANDKKEDGKIISRLVNVVGTLETYSKTVEVDVPSVDVTINKAGRTITIPEYTTPYEKKEYIIIADDIELLDSSKTSEKSNKIVTAPQEIETEEEIDDDELDDDFVVVVNKGAKSKDKDKEEKKEKATKSKAKSKAKTSEKIEENDLMDDIKDDIDTNELDGDCPF